MAVPSSYIGHWIWYYITLSVVYIHTSMVIVSAIDLKFLQAFPGNVVDEDEANITLPIMMNIIPPNASLTFDVVVNISVTGGTATSKDI